MPTTMKVMSIRTCLYAVLGFANSSIIQVYSKDFSYVNPSPLVVPYITPFLKPHMASIFVFGPNAQFWRITSASFSPLHPFWQTYVI